MRKLAMAVISLGILLLLSSVSFAQPCTSPGSIKSVRNIKTGNKEYVIFQLKKPLNSGYSYSVTTVSGPTFTEAASGNSVTVAGTNFKKVRFQGITWMCVIKEIFSLPKPKIKGIKKIDQSEGVVEYVIGYSPASVIHYFYDVGSIRWVVVRFQ